MIEFFVLIIIVVFAAYVVLSFTMFPVYVPVNIIMMISLIIFISRDIKEEGMQRYYMISLLLAAIFFIMKDFRLFEAVFWLLEYKMFFSMITIAFLLIHVLANLTMFIEDYIKRKIKNKKK